MPRSQRGRVAIDATSASAAPIEVRHDEINAAVREAVARVRRGDVAAAFVAALRPRRFAHWSALVSYAFAATLPEHAFREMLGRPTCATCGAVARLNVFPSDRFSRMRESGTVALDSLRYALYDLACFRADAFVAPDETDRRVFDAAVARIANCPADAKTFAAEAALGAIFPSRTDRKLFLGVLGACGVLASPTHPGFWPAFVPYEERARLDTIPYTYPVRWWRRSFGISRDALHAFGLDAYLSAATLAAIDRSAR